MVFTTLKTGHAGQQCLPYHATCGLKTTVHHPFVASHTRTVLSSLPDASSVLERVQHIQGTPGQYGPSQGAPGQYDSSQGRCRRYPRQQRPENVCKGYQANIFNTIQHIWGHHMMQVKAGGTDPSWLYDTQFTPPVGRAVGGMACMS